MRGVAMRPGRMMLQVMPSRPTSRARVLDQPTSDRRNAFDRPRLGIGATTPDEVEVMIRPHLRSRMPGSTLSVSAMTDSTIVWKLCCHNAASWPETVLGLGPPVLFTRMSMGPSSASIRSTFGPICARSPRSQVRGSALPPSCRRTRAVSSTAALSISPSATRTPSADSARAIARPSPPPAPRTSAVLPRIPRSIIVSVPVVGSCRGAFRTAPCRLPRSGRRPFPAARSRSRTRCGNRAQARRRCRGRRRRRPPPAAT